MKLTVHHLRLPLAHEFTIARGSMTTQSSLIVELEHGGLRGYGEVTENSFYGHSYDSIAASLRKTIPFLSGYADQDPTELWRQMSSCVDGDMFALSALDMAAHDLRGRQLGVPTWQHWGLEWKNVPESSYTIGIDDIDRMVNKLNEQAGWNIYKIKLGTARDLEIVKELRLHTDAVFRVDANCGWTPDETVRNSRALSELNVEFIEQPLPLNASPADQQKVFKESALPIVADENCQTMDDVARCDGTFHGVNVKICKCGGLSAALQMLRHARQRNLRTMVGCMVESSIGISGAAQLLPLLDYADLDGAVLLDDEPCTGVRIIKGHVTPSIHSGCGGEILAERLDEFQLSPPEILC